MVWDKMNLHDPQPKVIIEKIEFNSFLYEEQNPNSMRDY